MRLSLGKKIVIMMIVLAIVLTLSCIGVTGLFIYNEMCDEYVITADSMSGTVAVMMDGDRLERLTDKVAALYENSEEKPDRSQAGKAGYDEYIAQYAHLTEDEDYLYIQDAITKIQYANEVDCVYIVYPDKENGMLVCVVDALDEDTFIPTGSCEYVPDGYVKYLDDPTQGLPAYVARTKAEGWLATSCAPVYNSSGEFVCFAAVDLSMNDVLSDVWSFLAVLGLMLAVLTVFITVLLIMYVKKKIVRPINMLSVAAENYGHNQAKGSKCEFSTLDIHTGDELEILLGSMIQMEKDIDSYIHSLSRTQAQLSNARQQADDMHELAHMDALTGIHNRLAYDKEMELLEKELKNGMQDFGIAMVDLNFLKNINDNYGHECGNAAIISLSHLICEVFVHSPVFRIGGDEFAVMLKSHDLENVEELSRKLNNCFVKLAEDPSVQESSKISAAFGYAVFDPEKDSCAQDVFKRADRHMYDCKKEMKALRK